MMTVIKEYGRLQRQAVRKHRRYTARQQYRHAMTNEQLATLQGGPIKVSPNYVHVSG